jgi:hypothetical protein
MFSESQLALVRKAVKVLVEHEQTIAGAIHDELAELFDLLHPEPVVEEIPAPVVEEIPAPVVETPADVVAIEEAVEAHFAAEEPKAE